MATRESIAAIVAMIAIAAIAAVVAIATRAAIEAKAAIVAIAAMDAIVAIAAICIQDMCSNGSKLQNLKKHVWGHALG